MNTLLQPIATQDGSLTFFNEESGELYHNKAGAYTEALENYYQASGALEILKTTGRLRLLDACYGLGYNTWVLINEVLQAGLQGFTLEVLAVERNPEILAVLPQILEFPRFDTLKVKTTPFEHNAYYRTQECITDNKAGSITIPVENNGAVQVDFRVADLRQVLRTLEGDFDLVFHDPFSPAKAPELWTVDIFRAYQRLLQNHQGKVLTYSAAGAVRGGFIEAGFQVAKTQPLGAKTGGTIAFLGKDTGAENTLSLTADERAYAESRSGIPYRDPDLSLDRADIVANRQQEQSTSPRTSGEAIRKRLPRPVHH